MHKVSKERWLFGLADLLKALAALIAATTALYLTLSTHPRDSYVHPRTPPQRSIRVKSTVSKQMTYVDQYRVSNVMGVGGCPIRALFLAQGWEMTFFRPGSFSREST
jgi:hypothetical protein